MKLEHKHLYMALPVLLLGMSATIQFSAAYLASRGNAAEVERDYYDRAVEWDAYQAEVAASEALGWSLEITSEPLVVPGQARIATLRITDAEGAPVEGLAGDVHAFQTANVDEAHQLRMQELEPGVYRAAYAPARYGNWIWRYALERVGPTGEVERFVGEALAYVPLAVPVAEPADGGPPLR